ncbi:MAG: uroporphyrinogen decarboxylase family protein, partial [Actinomycetota bacterium]
MDSRTRVEAALALDVADRAPAGWWGHTFVEEWSPEDLAVITVDRARTYNWDFVKFQPRACSFAQAFGADYRPSGNAHTAPISGKQTITGLEDWQNLSLVNPKALSDQVESISRVVTELGPSVPVIQTVFSPLSVAAYLVGADKPKVLDELRADPDVVGRGLSKIASALIEFAADSFGAGAAGVFYAISGFSSTEMTTTDEYREIALDFDRQILEAVPAGAWFNVLHMCGPALHFDIAAGLPAQAVSWSVHDAGNPTLKEGRDATNKAV